MKINPAKFKSEIDRFAADKHPGLSRSEVLVLISKVAGYHSARSIERRCIGKDTNTNPVIGDVIAKFLGCKVADITGGDDEP